MTATSNLAHQAVAPWIRDESQHRRDIARTVNAILQGGLNVTSDVTLTASSSTTTIVDARIGYTSAIIPAMPLTLNGAIALDSGIWFDMPKTGSVIVHHAADIATDQTIRFVFIG